MRMYPKLKKQNVILNNGEYVKYSPESPSSKAKRMIKQVTDGKDVNIYKLWHPKGGGGRKRVVQRIYREVAEDLGRMPLGSLADVYAMGEEGRRKAIRYASRDAHSTLAVYFALLPRLQELGLA